MGVAEEEEGAWKEGVNGYEARAYHAGLSGNIYYDSLYSALISGANVRRKLKYHRTGAWRGEEEVASVRAESSAVVDADVLDESLL